MNADPHAREYLAAASALHEQTVSPRGFRPGQRVLVPRAFGSGYQEGTVYSTTDERRLGRCYLVDTEQGRLLILPDEMQELEQRTAGQRS